MGRQDFRTFGEYMRPEHGQPSAAMEDYLEMICRLSEGDSPVRIGDLACALGVRPPAVTKMVRRLAELGLAEYQKYGAITLLKAGRDAGAELLRRHEIVERFLSLAGVPGSVLLVETEKIEHTVGAETLSALGMLCDFLVSDTEIRAKFAAFRENYSAQGCAAIPDSSTSREISPSSRAGGLE